MKTCCSHKCLMAGICALYLLLSFEVAAQTPLPQNQLVSIPPTPQASALLKFLETPVSEYTGVANTSVKITEIKLGALTFPVSLNYHSTGFKVEEQSGNAGLGWALVAGGSVTRTVMGEPDFGANSPYAIFPQDRPLQPKKEHVGLGVYEENADYTLLMQLMGNPVVTSELNMPPSSSQAAALDVKPDLFYYSYFDRSGKFFYTNDGKAHTIPFSNLQVDRASPGFTIKDELGNEFRYDVLEINRTASVIFSDHPDFGGGGGSVLNHVYHLSRITTPTHDTLSITYQSQNYSYTSRPSYSRYRTLPGQAGCAQVDAETRLETTTDVQGKFISEITSNRGHRVKFHYGDCQRLDMPGSYPLDKVEVFEGENVLVFQLEQGYFGLAGYSCNTQVDRNSVKLKLNRVTQVGMGDYTFSYHNENVGMPERLGSQTDHWGYYNGVGGVFPPDPRFGYPHGADKSPNSEYAKYGMLYRLDFPTGGYELLEYEGNTFVDTTYSVVQVHDGAQIHYEANEPYREQQFTIPPNADPSSIFVQYASTEGTADPQFSILVTGENYQRAFSGTSAPQEFIHLPQGQYSIQVYQNGVFEEGYFRINWTETDVGEKVVGEVPGGGLRIKTIMKFDSPAASAPALTYRYTYEKDGGATSGMLFSKPKYSYLYYRTAYDPVVEGNGVVTEKTCVYYTQSSQSQLPLSGQQRGSIVYTRVQRYAESASGENNGYSDNTYSFVPDLIPYQGYPFTPATSYEWMCGYLLLSEIYEGGEEGYVRKSRTTNAYEYNFTPPDYHQNHVESGAHLTPPTKPNEAHAVSLHIQLIRPEHRKFGSMSFSLVPAIFNIEYSKLVSSWVYLKSTKKEEFHKDSPTVTTTTNYAYLNPSHAQPSVTGTTVGNGKVIYQLQTYPQDYAAGNAFIDDLKTKGRLAVPIESVSYQDDRGVYSILSGQINEYKPGGLGLLDKQYLMESPNAVPLGEFKFSNTAVGQIPDFSQGLAYNKDSRYKRRVEVGRYSPAGKVQEITPEGGHATAYLWGYSEQYPIAQVTNASFSSVSQILGDEAIRNFAILANPSDSEVENFLAPLRSHPALREATVTTHTYIPHVGVKSTEDVNGKRLHYSYDALNRLKMIKDHEDNIISSYEYHYQGE